MRFHIHLRSPWLGLYHVPATLSASHTFPESKKGKSVEKVGPNADKRGTKLNIMHDHANSDGMKGTGLGLLFSVYFLSILRNLSISVLNSN